MLCVTTDSIDGREVLSYQGLVAAEVVLGANFVKDMLAGVTDFAGGRSTSYEKVFERGRTAALDQLRQKAAALNADAILTIRFNYQVLGAENGMMMVAATGTAVQLVKSDAEKAKDRAHAEAEVAAYYLEIGGTERGPFSLVQLRELISSNRIEETAKVRAEGRDGTSLLADILA